MIKQAAAYAAAASIGTVVGTFVGAIFGVAMMSVAYAKKMEEGRVNGESRPE